MAGASEGTQTSLARTYPGSTATLNQARSDLVELLRRNDLQPVIADAELVLSELASNAIEASPEKDYRVALEIRTDQLVVAVTNQSQAVLENAGHQGPDHVLAPQGRGLMIVNALAESVDITQTDSEITVLAVLSLPER